MIKNRFNYKKLKTGILYLYIHFVTELICFFVLNNYIESAPLTWMIMLSYDMLAFVPQSIIGYISDKIPKIPLGLIGFGLMIISLLMRDFTQLIFLPLTLLCLGNACTHVSGAEVTLRTSKGSLSQSALFVSGGSFGVISGKLLAGAGAPVWLPIILAITAIPCVILAKIYLNDEYKNGTEECTEFDYANKNVNKYIIILLSVFVVIVRGFMAYGIPTSWQKTTLQTVALFAFMGLGKALGGIFADLFGAKKTALASVAVALPLLLFGDNIMFVSLLGVMFFSMTMSISLAVLVSVLPETPGLAFGLTTIGLFLGTMPVFFIKIKGFIPNCIMLTILTAVCIVCLAVSLRKDKKNDDLD